MNKNKVVIKNFPVSNFIIPSSLFSNPLISLDEKILISFFFLYTLDPTKEYTLIINQTELAQRCGLRVCKLIQLLGFLQENGWIEFTHNSHVVINFTTKYLSTTQELYREMSTIQSNEHSSKAKIGPSYSAHSDPILYTINYKKLKQKEKREGLPAMFVKFWSSYPKKVCKNDAQNSFAELGEKLTPEFADMLVSKLHAQRKHRAWMSKNNRWMPDWKNPSSWLKNECWMDDCEIPPEKPKKSINFFKKEEIKRASDETVSKSMASIRQILKGMGVDALLK